LVPSPLTPYGLRRSRAVQRLARVRGQWAHRVRDRPSGPFGRCPHLYTPTDLPPTEFAGRCLHLLPHVARAVQRDGDRAGGPTLVNIRGSLWQGKGDGQSCAGRMVCCTRYRIWLRMDYHRPGLCSLPRPELARTARKSLTGTADPRFWRTADRNDAPRVPGLAHTAIRICGVCSNPGFNITTADAYTWPSVLLEDRARQHSRSGPNKRFFVLSSGGYSADARGRATLTATRLADVRRLPGNRILCDQAGRLCD